MRFYTPGYWRRAGLAAVGIAGLLAATATLAQPPRGERGPGGGVDTAVSRLMAFDANGDGKLSKDEVTDQRLQPLLQRADANHDGVVTKEELTDLLTKEAASVRAPAGGPGGGPGGPGGPPPDGGPGGPGGPPGAGPGGPGGGPGGRGPGGPGGQGGPQPGQVLPPFLQEQLDLTDAQRRELQELQKDVDARLAKILTPQQLQQLRQMGRRGPGGGPGGPGGGPGGPGGGPGGGGNGNGRPNRPPQ